MNSKVSYNNKDYFINDLNLEDNVYFRKYPKDYDDPTYNNFDELVGYLKLLNNDNFFIDNKFDYNPTGKIKTSYGTGDLICICGCNRCDSLFYVKNLKTNIIFAVGSSCITKFIPEITPWINKIIRTDICCLCDKPLFYNNCKNRPKTADKKHCGHCIECWTK